MIDYYACIKHKYPTIPDSAFNLVDINGVVSIDYWDISYGPQPTMLELEEEYLSVVKQRALVDIKEIRRLGLDKAALSAGILAVYNTNYEAATAFLAGNTTQEIKNGMTALDYLTGFGARLQMTAEQFANYIIVENIRVGPSVYEVEKRYLALTYGGDIPSGIYPISMLSNETSILAAVENYKTYCGV